MPCSQTSSFPRWPRALSSAPARVLGIGAACPNLPPDTLRDAEWEFLALWARASVTSVRMGLAASWLLFAAGLIGAVGAILAGRKV